MDTRAELETELQNLLLAADNASLFPAARLTTLIQDAYKWATGLYPWQVLVKGKYTGTQADLAYYDYPEDFRTGTVVRVAIDGKEYNRKAFEDFLDYKERYSTSNKRIYALYARQIHVSPTPTTTDDDNFEVWGAVEADDLSASNSTTIWSGNNPTGNEAVVRKAFSVAMRRVDGSLSKEEEAVARGMLQELFGQESRQLQRDQRIQHPKFSVPDFFHGGQTSAIGKFSYDPEEDL